jgi:hypothetical protein
MVLVTNLKEKGHVRQNYALAPTHDPPSHSIETKKKIKKIKTYDVFPKVKYRYHIKSLFHVKKL